MSKSCCIICGQQECPGHTYSVPGRAVTDNSAVIRALEKRVEELEDDRDNWKSLASQINTDWIPANKQMSARIAGLESVMQDAKQVIERQREERLKLEAEEQLFNKTFDAQQVIIEQLRADNQRMRDTIIYAKGRMKAYGIVDARIDLPGGGE